MAKLEIISSGETSVTAPEVNVTADKSTFSGDVAIGGNLAVVGSVGGKSGLFGGVTVETHNHDYQDDNATRTSQGPNKS